MTIFTDSKLTTDILKKCVDDFETPFYLYDESMIIKQCSDLLKMPNAYGIEISYAVKANTSLAVLQLIHNQSLSFDASSMNEVRRINKAGIPFNKIMLTTQEVPEGKERIDLEKMILNGLKYNICSLRQLKLISKFASENNIRFSIRVHPGVGSGESLTRNTGDKYSCFGVHLTDIEEALSLSRKYNVIFDEIHIHIGSGADPIIWRDNIVRELGFVEKYFSDVKIVNFGGGLKVARMPNDNHANLFELGLFAKEKIEEFYRKTRRKLKFKIEPGTFVVANAGFIVTKVLDIKQTGTSGFSFIVTDGGMELNARPLFYGSKHPFYIVSKNGELISNEYNESTLFKEPEKHIIVGRCCETGDSQCLDENHNITPRLMGTPEVGDFLIIGGTGAYCSSMAPFNYNSHCQSAEILLRSDLSIDVIRKQQTLEQIIQNEQPLRKIT